MTGSLAGIAPRNQALAISIAVAFGVTLLLLPAASHGQDAKGAVSFTANESEEAVRAYWTPERIRSAKPLELHPRTDPGGSSRGHATVGTRKARSGAPPSVAAPASLGQPLLSPSDEEAEGKSAAVPFEQDTQADGYFTVSRVIPDAAVTLYPYRTVGKLLFTVQKSGILPPGDYTCSAAVIANRLVVTAGHCVASPSPSPSRRFVYTNIMFTPAFNKAANPTAPFGTWTPSSQWVVYSWLASAGTVPNSQDVAILIVRDQVPPGGKSSMKIGQVTGFLGWETLALENGNDISELGYPCNLDYCARLDINTGGVSFYNGDNTWIMGSAFRGGSSGAPWIQDFGFRPKGAPGVPFGGNLVVAVNSYGPASNGLLYNGASQLDDRFARTFNAACAAASGNC